MEESLDISQLDSRNVRRVGLNEMSDDLIREIGQWYPGTYAVMIQLNRRFRNIMKSIKHKVITKTYAKEHVSIILPGRIDEPFLTNFANAVDQNVTDFRPLDILTIKFIPNEAYFKWSNRFQEVMPRIINIISEEIIDGSNLINGILSI